MRLSLEKAQGLYFFSFPRLFPLVSAFYFSSVRAKKSGKSCLLPRGFVLLFFSWGKKDKNGYEEGWLETEKKKKLFGLDFSQIRFMHGYG